MKLNKYNLVWIVMNCYRHNTIKNYNGNQFSGDSYFLAHLSNEDNISSAALIAAAIITLPFNLITPGYGLIALPFVHLLLVTTLSFLDTYSTRKYRVRLNFKKTVDWVLNDDPQKRRGVI